MFTRGDDGVYRSTLLMSHPWIEHGFASRHSGDWPGEYQRVRQIHSNVVIGDDSPDNTEGDAIVSRRAGQWVGIRTADCVPILLADPVTRCVASVHAGWKGTAAGISSEAVRTMVESYGTDPRHLLAAIGPAIGRCCFEVGPEVALEFETLFPEAVLPAQAIDLPEANRRQLVSAGLTASSIDMAHLCTRCGVEEFHSFRRDREASGRMVAAIKINN